MGGLRRNGVCYCVKPDQIYSSSQAEILIRLEFSLPVVHKGAQEVIGVRKILPLIQHLSFDSAKEVVSESELEGDRDSEEEIVSYFSANFLLVSLLTTTFCEWIFSISVSYCYVEVKHVATVKRRK